MSESLIFPPRVQLMCDIINDRYSALGQAGTYPGHGEDGAQYAADFWTTNKDVHDAVLHWVIENADWLGIKYIISWRRIWSVARANEGIRPYERDANNDGILSASEQHTNHVHISFDPSKDDMAVEIKLSDADIAKIAKAVWEWDRIQPPAGLSTESNPTWSPRGFLQYIAGKVKNG